MQIFARVPRKGGVKRQWGSRKRHILVRSLAISLDVLEVRPTLLHRII